MLALKKITKVYEVAGAKQKALKSVDLNFRRSEFVSVLGQSGSGKTTLLNIIGGLDKYTTGDLLINGVSTKKYTDRDWDTYRNHRVGFVFQSYNLIPHQTALQNVELALTLCGVSKDERRKRAKAVLKKVGLERQMNKKPNQMSGGQMQRIAIARALVNDPDILLADEPTGALDSETSVQIMELLSEIARDKLVVMVTHNPDLASRYSTRIVRLLDGAIIEDTNAYDGVEETVKEVKAKYQKSKMNFKTAFSLSLNNLMTKKGRTILTAFAGSIGIIGIALILSLSNGIQKYIDRTEQETLGSYPLMLEKESVDMSSMLVSLMGNGDEEVYSDGKIHSKNIMGNMMESMTADVQTNDLKSFKKYIEENDEIRKYVSDISYQYNITLNIYKNDDTVTRVNPTTVLDTLGMGTSNMSSVYSSYMSNYDVFTNLFENKQLNEQLYDVVEGRWPEAYNEVVLMVDKNNQISDYTLYSLGILSQDDLKEQFNKMVAGESVSFDSHEYEPRELLDLSFKVVLNTDYYEKVKGIWLDKSNDSAYMRKVLNNALELKVVGVVKASEESAAGTKSYGLVGYDSSLYEYLIKEINASLIVKEQIANPDVNVFTGTGFSSSSSFDMGNLTKEQMLMVQKMSPEELAEYINTYSANASTSYVENMKKLGIAEIDDPDGIYIYPIDFDAKEEITKFIDSYNEGKSEDEKITYTDLVGTMMSSVSSIVNVISSVLIAFVAISLIVSSIMIAIITYISVIERTKEIGILRAIGASKKDISRVFNAETLIEGLIAGVLGIVVTVLLNVPINRVIKKVVNISGIASLPVKGAIVLIFISVLLTIIAGFIPAKLASKKDPVVALRSE